MPKFLNNFFFTGQFIPHGHCYLWKPGLVWLHVVSDSLIALAYYSIALMPVYFVRKRRDLPFEWIFLIFGTFIVGGTTHLMEVWTSWHPTYWLSGFIKGITAFVSLCTAVLLIPSILKALTLPSPTQLHAANVALKNEITERKRMEEQVRLLQTMMLEIGESKDAESALLESKTRLSLINSISTEINSGMSVEQVIKSTVKQISRYFNTLRVAYSTIHAGGILSVLHSIEPPGMVQLTGKVVDLTAAPEYFNALRVSGPVIVEDVTTDTRLAPLADAISASDTKAILDVPLQHSQRLVGLLSFESPEPKKWSEHEIVTLIEVAYYLSVAIKEAYVQQERQGAEEELLAISVALENAVEGISQLDTQGRYIVVNRAHASMFGYKPEEMIDMEWQATVHPEDREKMMTAYQNMLTNGKVEAEARGLRKDGSVFYKQLMMISAIDMRQKFMGHYSFIKDITERKRTEAALRESEERFKTFMNNSPVMAFMKDEDGRYIYVNEPLERMFNVNLTDLQGKTDFDWLPDTTAKHLREHDIAVLSTGKTAEVLETVPTPDGCLHYWLVFKFLVKDVSGRWLLGGVAIDITERKRVEEEIKASLQEKEVLLKEVHHRVKNNLQVIDSLFRHQCRHTKDKQTNEILKECQNRVNSMALLHEKLYQSKDLSKINFAGYIQNLVANLFDSYNFLTSYTALKINVDDSFLQIETALPCGLIVNELVSNSLKYAFPAGRKGEIEIIFHSDADHIFLLIVKDNGVGLPENFDFQKLQSLGLKLVKSLIRQLGGTIEINGSGGTEFIIRFPGVNDNVKK